MISKYIKYFRFSFILIIIYFLISLIGSKYIIETKFSLDRKDIKEIEKLTSKVFKFTNHNLGYMNHNRLTSGIGVISFTNIDNKITSYPYFFYQSLFNYLKLDGYLCGGHSEYLKKILDEHGVKSFTYNHGTNEKGASHIVVIAEINDKLYLFDPTYNAIYKRDKKYLPFGELLNIARVEKNLANYIHIINPEDKIYNIKLNRYINYNPNDMTNFFDRYKIVSGEKKHILLNKIGMHFSSESSRNYFLSKYNYLKEL